MKYSFPELELPSLDSSTLSESDSKERLMSKRIGKKKHRGLPHSLNGDLSRLKQGRKSRKNSRIVEELAKPNTIYKFLADLEPV